MKIERLNDLDLKLLAIITGLIIFVFITSMNMVNASQAKQDTLIQADHQDIIDANTKIATIMQHNVDEDLRLERIENKLDYLITEVKNNG